VLRSRIGLVLAVLLHGLLLCELCLASPAAPATSPAAPATSPVEGDLRVASVDTTSWPAVDVRVVVPEVLSAITLPAKAFAVTVGGHRVRADPSRINPSEWDVAVVMAAGRRTPPATREAIRGTALELAVRLPAGVRATAVVAGHPAETATPDRERVTRLITEAPLAGNGDVITAPVLRAAIDAVALPGRQAAVVVLGDVRASRGIGAAAPELLRRQAQLYAVSSAGPPPPDLARAAARSGGRVVAVDTAHLLAATDGVAADLSGQYHLHFTVPDGTRASSMSATILVTYMGVTRRVAVTLARPAGGRAGPAGASSSHPLRPLLRAGVAVLVVVLAAAAILAVRSRKRPEPRHRAPKRRLGKPRPSPRRTR
jgi:hypothetical protein